MANDINDFPVNQARASSEDCRVQIGPFTFTGGTSLYAIADLDHLFRDAYAKQGPRAFEDPKSAAVVHEAGHAVVFACFGLQVSCVKVRQKKKGADRGHWIGLTEVVGGYKFELDPQTAVNDDVRNACILFAGRAAELLFDTENFRLASSMDELVTVRALVLSIANKADLLPDEVQTKIAAMTFRILQENEAIVREIARLLNLKGVIRREALAPTLARVKRPRLH
jgi:hypothetical protein